MDTEQAKFILASYRPDGADANEEAFSEALALAASDRDLGQWLAAERAHDAAFSAALNSVTLPEDLREKLLAAVDSHAQQIAVDEHDGALIGALAQIQPPAGLRDQILAALDVEEKVVPMKKKSPFRAVVTGLAVAAAIAVAAIFAFQVSGGEQAGALTAGHFAHSGRNYLARNFDKAALDAMNTDVEQLYNYLETHDSAGPNAVPGALAEARGIGCKTIEIEGHPASLVCYMLATGEVVHIVTVDRALFDEDLAALAAAGENCYFCPAGTWAITSWQDGDKAHFAYSSDMNPAQLSTLF